MSKGNRKPLTLSAVFFDNSVLELKNISDDEFDACCKKVERERKDRMVQAIKKYWVRWYTCYETMGPFTLYTPWWQSGFTCEEPERQILVAAIKAESEKEVKDILLGCYDKRPDDIEISFIDELEENWRPETNKSGRFPCASWMSKYWEREKYLQTE